MIDEEGIRWERILFISKIPSLTSFKLKNQNPYREKSNTKTNTKTNPREKQNSCTVGKNLNYGFS